MSSFASSPLALRDERRFNASCTRPGSAAREVVDSLATSADSLSRVLLVDGRCFCKNNGIGNLFGNYVTWFTVAALTRRALFVDWLGLSHGSTSVANGRDVPWPNASACMAAVDGVACSRVAPIANAAPSRELHNTPTPVARSCACL